MIGLTSLFAYENSFTGTIPTEFGLLTNLAVFTCNSNSLSGTVPFELCDLPSLNELYINSGSSNPQISCSPDCLSSVPNTILPSAICPTVQEQVICSLVAATDIATAYAALATDWSCTSDGVTNTDPCNPSWARLTCNGGVVDSINWYSAGVTGA